MVVILFQVGEMLTISVYYLMENYATRNKQNCRFFSKAYMHLYMLLAKLEMLNLNNSSKIVC